MNKGEWNEEIRSRLRAEKGHEVVVATATDLMRIMNYKDMKSFKKTWLGTIHPVVMKQYAVKDFIDANYGINLDYTPTGFYLLGQCCRYGASGNQVHGLSVNDNFFAYQDPAGYGGFPILAADAMSAWD